MSWVIRQLAREGQVIAKAADLIKNPLALEFLDLDEKASYSESELETAIIDKLQAFMLELGKGFLFESRQRRFTFDDKHFRVDLVLYNRLLRCYVLLDLKIGEITHGDLGQMQMYVNYFDRKVKLDDELPTVGNRSQLMFGTGSSPICVRFEQPVDAESWIKKYLRGTIDKHAAGDRYLELPPMAALGPSNTLVAQRDPKCVLIGTSYRGAPGKTQLEIEKREQEFVDSMHGEPHANSSTWAHSFDRVKGGLLTVACSNQEMHLPEAFDGGIRTGDELETCRLLHHLFHTFEALALGVDLDGNRFGFRMHISAADEARQEMLFVDIQALVEIFRRQYENEKQEANQDSVDPEERASSLACYGQLLDHLVIERVSDHDGLPYVAVRSGIEIPSLDLLVASLISAAAE